jgi:1-acyl-sn-glycerol-3-phosphate acyltransferase
LGHKPGKLTQALGLLRQIPLGRSLRGAYTALTLFGVLGTPALLWSRLHGAGARRALGPAARLVLKMLGLRLKVTGSPHPGPCLIVANHASLLDPIALLACSPRPLLFLVAPWIYDHPILARGLRQMGHLKVTRGEAGGAPQLAQNIVERIQQGHTLAAFPEGGLETSPGLREFNLGVFQVAAENHLVIQPVVLKGTRTAMPWPHLVPLPMQLEAHFGPPLRAQGTDLVAAVELARQARQWIGEQCGEPILQQRLRRER